MPGEGSIFRLANGRWAAQVSIGGRTNRQIIRRSARTRAEARELLEQLRAERRVGVRPSRMTSGDYLTQWVRDVRNIRPTTRHGYQVVVAHHLVPTMGSIPLRDLSPVDVEHALAARAPHLSAKSVRNMHAVLRRALGQAVRAGILTRNVAAREFVDAPRVPVEEPDSLTTDEVRRLLEAARGDRFEAAIVLALGTGLRQGELLGLAWEDLNLDRGRLHVRRELARQDGRYLRAELKTERSRRVVPLTPAIVGVLRAHRQRVIDAGFVPTRTGPVFTNRRGKALSGSWLTHHLYELLERAGVRRIPFKNLRTTFASRLFEAGVPDLTIASLMGHARTHTTKQHYIAETTTAAEEAIEKLVG
jgi:integrase